MVRKAPLISVILLLLLLGSNLVLSEKEQASDFSQFHGDERHNGFITSTGPISAYLAWKINQRCDGMVASSGRLLVVDGKDIHILNETSGVTLRDVLGDCYKCELRTRYPVIGAGNIFVSYYDNTFMNICINGLCEHESVWIIAKNLFSLDERWSINIPLIFPNIQLPYNKILLAYSRGKLFEAFDGVLRARIASSGNILWEVKFKNSTISTIPTVADDVVVIGFLDDSRVVALAENGEVLWNFTTDSPVVSSSAYSSNYFYFGSINGIVYAVSKEGEKLWHTKLGGGVETTPAVAFGKVFVGSDDGNLYVLNATSGELLWMYSTEGPITASPIVSINEIVYIGSTDGKIYALKTENGDLVWSDNTGSSIEVTPVLDNGIVFVASSDGTIRAYYTVNVSNTPSTAVKSDTTVATVTQTITNTQTVTQTVAITTATQITAIPTTITLTTTKKEVSYIPTATVIVEESFFGEEVVALGISIAMIITSIVIGLWLKRK